MGLSRIMGALSLNGSSSSLLSTPAASYTKESTGSRIIDDQAPVSMPKSILVTSPTSNPYPAPSSSKRRIGPSFGKKKRGSRVPPNAPLPPTSPEAVVVRKKKTHRVSFAEGVQVWEVSSPPLSTSDFPKGEGEEGTKANEPKTEAVISTPSEAENDANPDGPLTPSNSDDGLDCYIPRSPSFEVSDLSSPSATAKKRRKVSNRSHRTSRFDPVPWSVEETTNATVTIYGKKGEVYGRYCIDLSGAIFSDPLPVANLWSQSFYFVAPLSSFFTPQAFQGSTSMRVSLFSPFTGIFKLRDEDEISCWHQEVKRSNHHSEFIQSVCIVQNPRDLTGYISSHGFVWPSKIAKAATTIPKSDSGFLIAVGHRLRNLTNEYRTYLKRCQNFPPPSERWWLQPDEDSSSDGSTSSSQVSPSHSILELSRLANGGSPSPSPTPSEESEPSPFITPQPSPQISPSPSGVNVSCSSLRPPPSEQQPPNALASAPNS